MMFKVKPIPGNRITKIKVRRSANEGFLVLIIHTPAAGRFELEIAHGLAWRVRHMIHKKLGFDEGEIALGQHLGRWSEGR
jgi:hypothetical protein